MVFIHDFTQIYKIPARTRRTAAVFKRTNRGHKVCRTDGRSNFTQKAV